MGEYLLSVHHDRAELAAMAGLGEEELRARFTAVDAFNQHLQDAGAWVFAGGLMPIEQSTTVDGRHQPPVVTDGPFAAADTHLGGFWVITAADHDEALRWAAEASAACQGPVEVRPFQGE